MNLQKLIDNKDHAAQYMIDEITYIIKNIGKRDPGSQGEHDACKYMEKVLKEDCGCEETVIEPFKEHPGSFFGWLYLTIPLALLGFACLFFAPVVSIISVAIGLFILVMQFGLYVKLVDKLFPEKTGHNLTAIKHCSGETKRRIFFNGHVDAAWEWPVNYKFGGAAFEAHALIGILGAVYYLVRGIVATCMGGPIHADSKQLFIAAMVGIVFIPFQITLFFMWNKKRIVDGANDNLSGCYMGIAILKELKDAGIELENTEIGVIVTGSEEAGLRGAFAWSEAHKNDYRDVPTFIYSYDTIHDPKYLMANYRALNGTTPSDKEVTDLFMEAAAELDIHCLKGWVPPMGGATDNAAFNKAGFRSAGITGLNHKLEDYYHTRRDTYDNMNKQGLADCYAVSVRVLEKFDDGAKQ